MSVDSISDAGVPAEAFLGVTLLLVDLVLVAAGGLLAAIRSLPGRRRHSWAIPLSTHAEQGICLEQRSFLRVHSTQEYAGRGRSLRADVAEFIE